MNKILAYYLKLKNSKPVLYFSQGIEHIKKVFYKIPVLNKILAGSAKLDNMYKNFILVKVFPRLIILQNKYNLSGIKSYLHNTPSQSVCSNIDKNTGALIFYFKSNAAKWRKTAMGIIVISTLIFVSQSFSARTFSPTHNKIGGYVAKIAIRGVIMSDLEMYDSLKKIRDNDSIKAVILQIDSPGGSVEPSERMYNLIRQIDQKKPVIAAMETLAASGGYMIAVAARHIFALKSTITGSIGVYTQSMQIKKIADKLGIEVTYIKSSPIKGSPHMFEKLSDEVFDMEQNLILELHDLFKAIVSERRALKNDDLKYVSNGQIFTGMRALKYNLIDEIGTDEEAFGYLVAHKLIPEKMEVRKINLKKEEKKKNPFMAASQALVSAFFGKMNEVKMENKIPVAQL